MSDLKLGMEVRDELSGFGGIVTTIGFHFDGCRRIGVTPSAEKDETVSSLPEEEFFFPRQLRVTAEKTKWTDLGATTDHKYSLGQYLEDKVTGFEGNVTVINTNLFNQPRYLLRGDSVDGEEADSFWTDETSLTPGVRAHDIDPDVDFDPKNEQSTGSSENLSQTRQMQDNKW